MGVKEHPAPRPVNTFGVFRVNFSVSLNAMTATLIIVPILGISGIGALIAGFAVAFVYAPLSTIVEKIGLDDVGEMVHGILILHLQFQGTRWQWQSYSLP